MEAWRQATQLQRSLLINVISNSSIEEVREWFRNVSLREIVDLSFRELRALAQMKRIPCYSRMLKEELIDALIQEEEDAISG